MLILSLISATSSAANIFNPISAKATSETTLQQRSAYLSKYGVVYYIQFSRRIIRSLFLGVSKTSPSQNNRAKFPFFFYTSIFTYRRKMEIHTVNRHNCLSLCSEPECFSLKETSVKYVDALVSWLLICRPRLKKETSVKYVDALVSW